MANDTIKQWLLKVATAVEEWPTMRTDSVEVWLAVSTPAGAMKHIAASIQDAREREAVEAALPRVTTEDFAVAAQRIRRAADALDGLRC
jgi:hypothetical protein